MYVVVGYLLALVNLFIVIALTSDTARIYLDFHAALCVLGGTVFSMIIAFKPSAISRLFQLFKLAAKRKDTDIGSLISEIVRVAKETRGEINQAYLGNFRTQHFFLRDGLQLISDGFTEEQIAEILEERIKAAENRYRDDEKFIKALAKIPPSFGLMGTTIGLIALFAQVGSSDALRKIGPSMAVAMTATLYGLLFAFAILNPMVDRVSEISLNNIRTRELILTGVLHLKGKKSPIFIEELLKSYLAFAAQKSFVTNKAKK